MTLVEYMQEVRTLTQDEVDHMTHERGDREDLTPAERLPFDDPAEYVVTFDRRPIHGPGAISGLRRMTLADALETVAIASRIPKTGRIIDADSLQEVTPAERLWLLS